MSNRYKGGVISATPPTTTGGNDGVASGAWTLEQQMQAQAAGLWPNQPVFYIEDVFSTYLYTGTGAAQTITNGINLSGKGGLVWTKYRTGAYWHTWFDTVRGNTKVLYSNATDAQGTLTDAITSFTSTGYTLGTDSNGGNNASTGSFVSWTFREQPKFFDIVTYTGNGVFGREISHNLGAVPAVIIIKATSIVKDWLVYTTAIDGSQDYLFLNTTAAKADSSITTPWTSTTFPVGGSDFDNGSGVTYVAYLFASNAGGFGATGLDNVISCGSYTGNGAAGGQLINLGYEAQWVMIKQTNVSGGGWWMMDVMRGYTVNGDFGGDASLYANTSQTEQNNVLGQPSALGFTPIQDNVNESGQTYIYIAIRRGPMKVPTSGTSVFSPLVGNNAQGTQNTTGFPVDLQWAKYRDGAIGTYDADRLRGVSTTSTTGGQHLITSSTAAETSSNATQFWNNTGFQTSSGWAGTSMAYWNFQRAPSFFDEVCYTGNGSSPGQTLNHNLNAVPELIIWKARSNGVNNWYVYNATVGAEFYVELNTTIAKLAFSLTGSRTPTNTVFHTCTGGDSSNNGNNITYVAYLFATCPGVSKVGSYTGTATTLQIDCGFTGGARFVLIKRTDSTGDWYVWDSARGIVAGNDPYLLLNSTAAEVTNTDYVDTYSAGFEISSTAPAAINANGGTYIFLAIA